MLQDSYRTHSIGRGMARAEVEVEMEAQLELKNFEIARLLECLRCYETMNREMVQRNQEAIGETYVIYLVFDSFDQVNVLIFFLPVRISVAGTSLASHFTCPRSTIIMLYFEFDNYACSRKIWMDIAPVLSENCLSGCRAGLSVEC
ncbi:uncharacterized protein DS421_3g80920 [Arachis hypogaea]|nr:uncharacterized protein DS421_3g80920 [Arachis hypogaea]